MKCSPPEVPDLLAGSGRGASGRVLSSLAGQPGACRRGVRRVFRRLADRLARSKDSQPGVGTHGAGGRRRGARRSRHPGHASGPTLPRRHRHSSRSWRPSACSSSYRPRWASATPGQRPGHLGALLFGMMNMMGMRSAGSSSIFSSAASAELEKEPGAIPAVAQWDPALYAYVAVASSDRHGPLEPDQPREDSREPASVKDVARWRIRDCPNHSSS